MRKTNYIVVVVKAKPEDGLDTEKAVEIERNDGFKRY